MAYTTGWWGDSSPEPYRTDRHQNSLGGPIAKISPAQKSKIQMRINKIIRRLPKNQKPNHTLACQKHGKFPRTAVLPDR